MYLYCITPTRKTKSLSFIEVCERQLKMVVVVIQNIECPVLLFGNLETIATAIDMIMIMLCLACLCNKVFSFPECRI